MQFQLNQELIDKIKRLVSERYDEELLIHLSGQHHADIAEILEELSLDEATYIIKLLDSEKTSEVLMELHEDDRKKILENLTEQEIAEEIEEMDTDDAADILAELSNDRTFLVINNLKDQELATNLKELLRYDENSAGGLMAKELIKVEAEWSVARCVREMRRQAEEVTRIHSIYVVDKEEKLIGRLSLKDLLTVKPDALIDDIYIPRVDFVHVHTEGEEVARVMKRYDLEAIPVVDEIGRLVGRITVDDIIDFMQEEADKDYQMAAGISQDIQADDSYFKQMKARFPWLILALIGSFFAVGIASGFQEALVQYGQLFFFTPLIAAMAGNVGVQSSAIIVQGIAKKSLSGSVFARVLKELSLSLLSGAILGVIVFLGSHYILGHEFRIGYSVSISLLVVMMIASVVGTFVPIMLDRLKIDPALATGPFITTSNDIFGILAYFTIAKAIIGF